MTRLWLILKFPILYVIHDPFWGPGALGFGSGASRGFVWWKNHLLGCLGARVMTKKQFLYFSLKLFDGFSYIFGLFWDPRDPGPLPSDSSCQTTYFHWTTTLEDTLGPNLWPKHQKGRFWKLLEGFGSFGKVWEGLGKFGEGSGRFWTCTCIPVFSHWK